MKVNDKIIPLDRGNKNQGTKFHKYISMVFPSISFKEWHSKGFWTEKLQIAMGEINTLQGVLPICAKCKKIRDDKGSWNQLESYIECHSEAHFSHGLCLECEETLYGDEEWYRKLKVN